MGQIESTLTGSSSNLYEEYDNYQKYVERRIILIGKTGTGKSTLGNAILGGQSFKNECVQMQSNTIHCQVGYRKTKDGKEIVVLDTPGLMDTKRKQEKIFEELCKCTAMTAPGPHAFCFVIRGDERFTQENIDTLDEFCAFFGQEIYKYMVVVFTHKASMGRGATTDDCLKSLPDEFQEKFSRFGGKKIAIECRAEKRLIKKQIKELLILIEEIIKWNNGGFYSEEKFKAAEEAFRKRIPKLQQEVEKKFESTKHMLEVEYQEKAKRFEERENALVTKLQEEMDKIEKEKQLKDKEKEKLQEEMKSLEEKLEKERKEKEKAKEDYNRRKEELDKKVVQDLRATVIEDRNRAREAVPETKGFGDMAKDIVKTGVGLAVDVATGGVVKALGGVIGSIGSWFTGK